MADPGRESDDATFGSGNATLDEVLMTIVVESLFFLENTPDDELDARAAERMESEIAYQLSRVDPADLRPFIDFVRRQAAASAWPAEREFLEKLPGYLGSPDS